MLLFSAVYCNTKIWLLNCINNLFKELQNSTFTSHHMALNQTREKFIECKFVHVAIYANSQSFYFLFYNRNLEERRGRIYGR